MLLSRHNNSGRLVVHPAKAHDATRVHVITRCPRWMDIAAIPDHYKSVYTENFPVLSNVRNGNGNGNGKGSVNTGGEWRNTLVGFTDAGTCRTCVKQLQAADATHEPDLVVAYMDVADIKHLASLLSMPLVLVVRVRGDTRHVQYWAFSR